VSSTETRGWFEVTRIAEGVHAIAEPLHAEEVISYLIIGAERAVLLDTGMGIGDIHQVSLRLTKEPITVVNSHHHYDHVGGNHLFRRIAIHDAEAPLLEEEAAAAFLLEAMRPENIWGPLPKGFDPSTYRIIPSTADRRLQEGDSLDLGGRRLRVLHTPGHSPGSICLLAEDEGMLFTGDTVYAGPLYAHFEHSNFEDYCRSMERLSAMAEDLKLVLPAHNFTPLDPHILVEISEGFEQIVAGQAAWKKVRTIWGSLRAYYFARFGVWLPEGV
jgi:glyoxylase-like metal-dependent hydrolase (beta-lactamase superfamily II)